MSFSKRNKPPSAFPFALNNTDHSLFGLLKRSFRKTLSFALLIIFIIYMIIMKDLFPSSPPPSSSASQHYSPPQSNFKFSNIMIDPQSPTLPIVIERTLDYVQSDDHPLCLSTIGGPPLTLWIAMTSWNDPALLRRSILSTSNQVLGTWPYRVDVKLVVYEDLSGDMLSAKEKVDFAKLLDVTFIADHEKGCAVGGCEQVGAAAAKWKIFDSIKKSSKPADYVFVLDGDDIFADDTVLLDLAKMVVTSKPWFIWGKHNGKYSEQCKDFQDRSASNYDFRRGRWGYCHPRIFQSHLLDVLTANDFKRADGDWLQKATDRPFIFKMLEASGISRSHFIDERAPMVNYTFNNNNGLLRFKKSVIGGDKEYVNSLPAIRIKPVVIHVIVAIHTRKNTYKFLRYLVQSVSDDDIVFHISLNDLKRLEEVTAIARLLSREKRRIIIHPIADNYGGFSRFLVARKVREKENLEFVIMIDDDMMVDEDTLTEVWKKRKPLSYSCFYGKTWDTSRLPDYWRPLNKGGILGLLDDAFELRNFKTWQYGGTGCSIVDASIFDDERLFQIPSRFLFVEDLWLSYIVALNGWTIDRLFDIHFSMDKVMSASGQWQGLKKTKSEMFNSLRDCPFSLVKLVERLI